jgi:hypothetical protein
VGFWWDKKKFNCGITPETDESKLRAFYDIMNFGGVPHEQNERASAPNNTPAPKPITSAESASILAKPATRRSSP